MVDVTHMWLIGSLASMSHGGAKRSGHARLTGEWESKAGMSWCPCGVGREDRVGTVWDHIHVYV